MVLRFDLVLKLRMPRIYCVYRGYRNTVFSTAHPLAKP